MLSAADDGLAGPWTPTAGCEPCSHPRGPVFALTPPWRERVTVQRFRVMGIYVVLVVAALVCAIAGIATLRTAASAGSTSPHGHHPPSGEDADPSGAKR